MAEPTLAEDLREAVDALCARNRTIYAASGRHSVDKALATRLETAIPVIEAAVEMATSMETRADLPSALGWLRQHGFVDANGFPTALGRQLLAMRLEGGE